MDFFRDPLVSITWWSAFGVFNFQQKLHGIRSSRRASGRIAGHSI
jgi:hypothetical protein